MDSREQVMPNALKIDGRCHSMTSPVSDPPSATLTPRATGSLQPSFRSGSRPRNRDTAGCWQPGPITERTHRQPANRAVNEPQITAYATCLEEQWPLPFDDVAGLGPSLGHPRPSRDRFLAAVFSIGQPPRNRDAAGCWQPIGRSPVRLPNEPTASPRIEE
jgi:hypothetical protein